MYSIEPTNTIPHQKIHEKGLALYNNRELIVIDNFEIYSYVWSVLSSNTLLFVALETRQNANYFQYEIRPILSLFTLEHLSILYNSLRIPLYLLEQRYSTGLEMVKTRLLAEEGFLERPHAGKKATTPPD